mmetsp:Transcript_11339/g.37546  ORF Transcript_11339/g.37546 Transcript_11339/m.37546 type:complete len:206 (-) Transcript_11339:57-674(-)
MTFHGARRKCAAEPTSNRSPETPLSESSNAARLDVPDRCSPPTNTKWAGRHGAPGPAALTLAHARPAGREADTSAARLAAPPPSWPPPAPPRRVPPARSERTALPSGAVLDGPSVSAPAAFAMAARRAQAGIPCGSACMWAASSPSSDTNTHAVSTTSPTRSIDAPQQRTVLRAPLGLSASGCARSAGATATPGRRYRGAGRSLR